MKIDITARAMDDLLEVQIRALELSRALKRAVTYAHNNRIFTIDDQNRDPNGLLVIHETTPPGHA